ncbi:MAG: 4-(cytidine 5'-diphospho)-2-C-methyl-D-erythritol kinase [Clostridia bacterium]|nr:4-(cytidine 5'-diphospho)-2-C-methyl-D-erythritol kinase [Clostridia bacterium]MBO7295945.1 4-(cytidine 5'-diphospho)-2-C-methyl-D-erythritol kinase [Clostridia bacterium]
MKMRACAKINLYLDVTAKRADGYHDIVSIMQSVDLCDEVSVQISENEHAEIVLRCGADLPCDGRNLAYKAAERYFAGLVPCRIEIDIDKHIPLQAGLAGGSADAAAVLCALNAHFGKYDEQELLRLGARLGADVPFCMVGGTRITRGIGEIMQACAPMPECCLVIARGGEGISTPWAYGALDEKYGDFKEQGNESEARLARVVNAMEQGDLAAMSDAMYNIFESVVLPVHKAAAAAKKTMLEGGAIGALMSGSGPSVVGIFTDEKAAQRVRDEIAQTGTAAFVCRPVN